ncbi:MAG: hypothetical protein JJE52_10630 [Acidimicrobiia bacterium]|nr:hypothetical protein [Acidimicrobiia bacterium]
MDTTFSIAVVFPPDVEAQERTHRIADTLAVSSAWRIGRGVLDPFADLDEVIANRPLPFPDIVVTVGQPGGLAVSIAVRSRAVLISVPRSRDSLSRHDIGLAARTQLRTATALHVITADQRRLTAGPVTVEARQPLGVTYRTEAGERTLTATVITVAPTPSGAELRTGESTAIVAATRVDVAGAGLVLDHDRRSRHTDQVRITALVDALRMATLR